MKTSRVLSATLLAISSIGVASGAAGAAPLKSCDSGDKLVSTTVGAAAATADTNLNGVVCEHIARGHAPKKPGPNPGSVSYYDDTI